MRILTFITLLSLAVGASAQSSGELLTVRVEGAPASLESAACDLGPELRGLSLQRDSDGAWVGSFAVLPGLVEGALKPQVHVYDGQRNEVAMPWGKGVSMKVGGSHFDSEGLSAVLSDRFTQFVFDDSVALDSLQFATRDGFVTPELSGRNSFILPNGVAPLNVAAITAKSADGQALVFEPDWTAADVANVEEEF